MSFILLYLSLSYFVTVVFLLFEGFILGDPASECFDALQVFVKSLLVEALMVGDALRAVGVDPPWEGELIGEFDGLFE